MHSQNGNRRHTSMIFPAIGPANGGLVEHRWPNGAAASEWLQLPDAKTPSC